MCPVYDMECRDCGIEEEFMLSISERDRKIPCAMCGKAMSRVLVHEIRFQLKGNGWARDGYSDTVGDIIKRNGSLKTDEEGTSL